MLKHLFFIIVFSIIISTSGHSQNVDFIDEKAFDAFMIDFNKEYHLERPIISRIDTFVPFIAAGEYGLFCGQKIGDLSKEDLAKIAPYSTNAIQARIIILNKMLRLNPLIKDIGLGDISVSYRIKYSNQNYSILLYNRAFE